MQYYLLLIINVADSKDYESYLPSSFSISSCLVFLFQFEEAAKGLSLSPIRVRFNSLRMANRKGPVTIFDYQLLEAATNKFSESNVLSEDVSGNVYKARFDDKFFAVVKKLDGVGSDAERKVDVIFYLKLVWVLNFAVWIFSLIINLYCRMK